jgi:hypothetical protein
VRAVGSLGDRIEQGARSRTGRVPAYFPHLS